MASIGIYTPFPPGIGGGERYIMTFANALQDTHEVAFLSSSSAEYKQVATALKIDMSKVQFLDFKKITGQNNFIANHTLKRQSIQFDIFFCLSNHITPPIIGLGKTNILIVQFPYPHIHFKRRFIEFCQKFAQSYLYEFTYSKILVYSEFTKSYVQQLTNIPIYILNPPVETQQFQAIPFIDKKNSIISVGRFVGTGDSKRQLEMVRCFKKFCQQYPDLSIEYVCVGGTRPEAIHQQYLAQVQREAQGCPVIFVLDTDFSTLRRLYSESKVFWHAKGYGAADEQPQFTEHFGISTVEAMSSGCIPVVYAAGGQIEIVQNKHNGFLWRGEDELFRTTADIFKDPRKSQTLAEAAVDSSSRFSLKAFRIKVGNLIAEILQ